MNFIVNGQTLRMLFKFENNNKQYIVYINENEEISASILVNNGDKSEMVAITDDEEWNYVQKIIEENLDVKSNL